MQKYIPHITFLTFLLTLSKSAFTQSGDSIKTYQKIVERHCFYTGKMLKTIDDDGFPKAVFEDGNKTVFEFLIEADDQKQILPNGDTIKVADSYFIRRVTFQVDSGKPHFYLKDNDFAAAKGLYFFRGGEGWYFLTDFTIKKGYIKGKRKNKKEWLIEASVSVEGTGSDISFKEIYFKSVFKTCN